MLVKALLLCTGHQKNTGVVCELGIGENKMSATASIKNKARETAYSPLVELLTRVGFGVRGILYVVMGILSFKVAIGKGGQLASPQGAIGAIARQPFGKTLLWVIMLGLFAYALWGLIRAVLDPLHKGGGAKGYLTRFGYFISALTYSFLGWTAFGYIKGTGSSSSGSQAKFLSGIMSKSWGLWLVAAVGLVVIGVGLLNIYMGFRRHFDRQFQPYVLTRRQAEVVILAARFGTIARGVVLAIVGALIFYAAYTSNPSQPVGFNAALAALLKQPFGPGLLSLVTLGLIAFGVYSLLGAAWFRMHRNMG